MSGKYATETLQANESGIARAAAILRAGGLVAVPTETVYGLAARADSEEAVGRIYEAKGRPSFNPLIVHVPTIERAERLAVFSAKARELAQDYWPGPLTLVLPRREDAGLAARVAAGLPTLALRMPDHPVMSALLEAVDFPLAAPSANRSGFISPTSAKHVLASLDGRIDAVIDGGASQAGLESTILAVRDDGNVDQLRPGPVKVARRNSASGFAGIEAPGQLASHYAPGKPLRLNAGDHGDDEFMIGFGDIAGDCTLSEVGDLKEAASRLYACLHLGAASDKPRMAVASIPDRDIGKAINDRLRRAATPPD
ncbi:L-threonylcarbamoyladenylate synthase [Qipengyuania nanhaisediminis]|uniref:Threonylcarbamoyl-AMP synthase n=1 Tax=Qipengyuania nanhaisediminis TaxID=604088 RepID=A0A1I5KVV2_9SPHN|nr:L-threonylcarbamoyladenylate synthase [Qipengyuania nanhaisediminis]SFO89229.1 L-threonylcarbamoyladenylate synthase [Qipengyuania nanhaisediminis]